MKPAVDLARARLQARQGVMRMPSEEEKRMRPIPFARGAALACLLAVPASAVADPIPSAGAGETIQACRYSETAERPRFKTLIRQYGQRRCVDTVHLSH